MTAIGFVLFMVAIIYFNIYNNSSSNPTIENIYSVLGVVGLLLVTCGVAVWLWEAMP